MSLVLLLRCRLPNEAHALQLGYVAIDHAPIFAHFVIHALVVFMLQVKVRWIHTGLC